jgi:hypothetical protein
VQCSWSHVEQVAGYRDERQRQERQREDETLGYETELEEWNRTHQMITFKQWLIMGAR